MWQNRIIPSLLDLSGVVPINLQQLGHSDLTAQTNKKQSLFGFILERKKQPWIKYILTLYSDLEIFWRVQNNWMRWNYRAFTHETSINLLNFTKKFAKKIKKYQFNSERISLESNYYCGFHFQKLSSPQSSLGLWRYSICRTAAL